MRFFTLFAALSLAAVSVGCAVASAHGVGLSVWARNLAAWIVGGLAAAAIARWGGAKVLTGFLVAAPIGLAATLLAAGQAGVHRWVDLGPAHVNLAEILLPPAVVAFVATSARSRWVWLAAAAIAALLAVQPDASQATAFGAALILTAAMASVSRILRGAGIAAVILAVAAAWLRRDPLSPVPEVEGIMGLARSLSPFAIVLAWAALGGAVLAPMVEGRSDRHIVRAASAALAAYGAVSAAAPLLGAFPVPLVGMGMSPILGLWLGAGLLTALAARPRAVRLAP